MVLVKESHLPYSFKKVCIHHGRETFLHLLKMANLQERMIMEFTKFCSDKLILLVKVIHLTSQFTVIMLELKM